MFNGIFQLDPSVFKGSITPGMVREVLLFFAVYPVYICCLLSTLCLSEANSENPDKRKREKE